MERRTALTSAKSFLCDHSLPFVWVKIDINSTINRAKPLCFSLMQAFLTQCPLMFAIDLYMLKSLQFNTDLESLHGVGSPRLHPLKGIKAEGGFSHTNKPKRQCHIWGKNPLRQGRICIYLTGHKL